MRWGIVVVAFGMTAIGCSSNVAQTCVGEGCDTTSTGGQNDSGDGTGSTAVSLSSSDGADGDSDSDDTEDPGPICIVGGGPGAIGICDLPWSCEDDVDCPPAMICNLELCEPQRSCDVIEDCQRDEQCVEGVCRVVSCDADAECGENHWCLAERCVASTGVEPCAIARGVEVSTLELEPRAGITDLTAMGISPTVAIARGDGSVDLMVLDGEAPMIVGTVSTTPADATRIAWTPAFGGASDPDLLSVGPSLVVNPSSSDFAEAIEIATDDAIDVTALGGTAAAITLHRDGAVATLRAWMVEGETLVESGSGVTVEGAASVELSRDGTDLLVVAPTAASIHDGLSLGDGDVFPVSGEHPLIAGAMAAGGGGDVIALALDGTTPALWVIRESSTPLLAALAETPTQVAVADVDGDGPLDLMVGSPSGVTWVRSVDAEACAQDIPLPVSTTSVVLADLDGDGDLELVAAGGSSVYVVRMLD